jgi:hypothetical protein
VDDDTDARVPEAAPLFNMLYGMFPCNTIAFLRSPTAYTKEVDCCFGKVLARDEDELIRSEAMVSPYNVYAHTIPYLITFLASTTPTPTSS